MDWEKEAARQKARADNLQKDLDRCLVEIRRFREIHQNIKQQLFVADSLVAQDKLSKYQYTYP